MKMWDKEVLFYIIIITVILMIPISLIILNGTQQDETPYFQIPVSYIEQLCSEKCLEFDAVFVMFNTTSYTCQCMDIETRNVFFTDI